jgi:myo-inositol-1(or 4)-monophosphatase
MQPALSDLEAIARRAGTILRDGYGQRHIINHKGALDLVTEMDGRSEDLILGAIRQSFPTHAILSEESGELAGDGEHCWFIDPLDGTINYAHGMPFFSVSLAYAWRGETRLGVVYDPLREECFSAEAGRGAFLNGQPIHVSSTTALSDSLMVTGFPHDDGGGAPDNLINYGRFQSITQGVRRLGSAALDLVYVACGRLDGFWEVTIHAWDIAAGGLITREAGGLVTRMDGSPDYLTPPCSILAANPRLHSLMLAILLES